MVFNDFSKKIKFRVSRFRAFTFRIIDACVVVVVVVVVLCIIIIITSNIGRGVENDFYKQWAYKK